MKESRNTIILALLVVCGFALTIGMQFIRESKPGANIDAEFAKKVCASLESYGLWADAAKEYEKLLDSGALAADERAKINYRVAEIYADKLSMPEKALPFLFAAKTAAGDSELGKKCDKKIIESLERAGKSLDASNYLAGAAAMENAGESGKSTAEVVIAKVGKETITLRQLNDEIQELPPNFQDQLKDPLKKEQFLKSIIVKRLALIASKRAGYDNDPAVLKKIEMAREEAILDKFEQMAIVSKMNVTDADVRAYYEFHKDEFTKKDDKGNKAQLSYEEVKERARAAAGKQRRREIMDQEIGKLQQSEGVEIYSDRIPNK